MKMARLPFSGDDTLATILPVMPGGRRGTVGWLYGAGGGAPKSGGSVSPGFGFDDGTYNDGSGDAGGWGDGGGAGSGSCNGSPALSGGPAYGQPGHDVFPQRQVGCCGPAVFVSPRDASTGRGQNGEVCYCFCWGVCMAAPGQ